jgi:hypothetical protein
MVAVDLEIMVTEIVPATVTVEAFAATKKILHEALDFALLDVDVTCGKRIEVAQILGAFCFYFGLAARPAAF